MVSLLYDCLSFFCSLPLFHTHFRLRWCACVCVCAFVHLFICVCVRGLAALPPPPVLSIIKPTLLFLYPSLSLDPFFVLLFGFVRSSIIFFFFPFFDFQILQCQAF